MEEQNEIVKIKPKNMYIPICITQAVCIAVILIVVLIMQFFFRGNYEKVKKWYNKNILEETEITARFDEETTSEI